jgi:hypothetical protein
MGDNNHIVINESSLTMVAGTMFDLCAASEVGRNIMSYLYKDENGQYLYPDPSQLVNGKANFSIGELKSSINATKSTIIATKGEYVTGNVQENHCLIYTSKAGISLEANFVGCDLVSTSRVLRVGTRPQYGGTSFSPAQLTFIDTDYNNDGKEMSSPGFFYQNCNVMWIGGKIDGYNTLVSCAFAPFECLDGFVGVHLYNTNLEGATVSGTNAEQNQNMVPTNAWTRYYRAVKDVVALIDGKEYKTEAEAIAAIKEGSNVYILRDFESEALPLSVSCTIYNAKDYFKVPGIVSATHKVENLNGIIK